MSQDRVKKPEGKGKGKGKDIGEKGGKARPKAKQRIMAPSPRLLRHRLSGVCDAPPLRQPGYRCFRRL